MGGRLSIKRNKKIKITIVLIVILLFSIFAIGGYVYFHQKPESVLANGNENSKFVKEMTDDEFRDYLQEKVDKSNFHLKIDTNMIFESSSAIGIVNILNPSSNTYSIRVKTYLTNSNELVYDSELIQPKFYVEEGKLLKNLDKGVYTTQSHISYYDLKTDEKIGETVVAGQLSVNN
ncbi:hypothetical protein IGK08_001465 [Enterococcus sp. DIV1286c]